MTSLLDFLRCSLGGGAYMAAVLVIMKVSLCDTCPEPPQGGRKPFFISLKAYSTSLIRKRHPLPQMPRALRWSWGGRRILMSEALLYM